MTDLLVYPTYPKKWEKIDTNIPEDQIGLLIEQYNTLFFLRKTIIEGRPDLVPKGHIYESLTDVYLSHVVIDLETDFLDLPLNDYSVEFHDRAVTLIDKTRLEIRKSILHKLVKYFEIPLEDSKLGEGSELSPRFIEIEQVLLDAWSILSLRWAIRRYKKEYGQYLRPSLMFAEFKRYADMKEIHFLLGEKVNSTFYDKALTIADELYNRRVSKFNTILMNP